MARYSIAQWFPAHSSNMTIGRGGNAIDRITIHHTAANNTTLRHLWGDPARNGSSHFFVSSTRIEQYVDTKDTAWTNTNFASNQRAITIEVNGRWHNGYKNQGTLDNLEKLLRVLRKDHPNARITYHMDEAKLAGNSTACPEDLKHKGYAKQVWDKVTTWLTPKPAPTPAPVQITYKPITPKWVEMNKNANLWNFNFTKWSDAKSVNPAEFKNGYPAGYAVSVVAEATNQLGAKYYMTAWSYDNGKIRQTFGFNKNDTRPHVPPVKPTPVPPKPVDTDPTKPGDGDVAEQLNVIQKALDRLKELTK